MCILFQNKVTELLVSGKRGRAEMTVVPILTRKNYWENHKLSLFEATGEVISTTNPKSGERQMFVGRNKCQDLLSCCCC